MQAWGPPVSSVRTSILICHALQDQWRLELGRKQNDAGSGPDTERYRLLGEHLAAESRASSMPQWLLTPWTCIP
eukprot:scaffold878_cov271-Pinguiococcus_pyrenoidosus.AAC.13